VDEVLQQIAVNLKERSSIEGILEAGHAPSDRTPRQPLDNRRASDLVVVSNREIKPNRRGRRKHACDRLELRLQSRYEHRATLDIHQIVTAAREVPHSDLTVLLTDLQLGSGAIVKGTPLEQARIREALELANSAKGLPRRCYFETALKSVFDLLKVTPPTDLEQRTRRLPATLAGLQNFDDRSSCILRVALRQPHAQTVARHRARHEDRDSLHSRQAVASRDELLDRDLDLLEVRERP
jgi:hypothetical protein